MNSYSFTLFTFAAVIFLLCSSSTGTSFRCNPDDEAGLLGFKAGITRDPSGILSSWKKDTDCCAWKGVACSEMGRVVILNITGESVHDTNSLSGTISPSLAKVEYLFSIHFLFQRKLTGSFPEFLFKLSNLRYLSLVHTGLSSSLPANIGALNQLEALKLERNKFSGPIPTSMSNMTQLITLKLVGNRLIAPIPNIFKSMKSLETLDLSRNWFSGELPPSIASLDRLLEFRASGNSLRFDMGKLTFRKTVQVLDLSWNMIYGEVPKVVAGLKKLNLSHNQLCGKLPATKFPASAFASNDCLCGSPLPPCKR